MLFPIKYSPLFQFTKDILYENVYFVKEEFLYNRIFYIAKLKKNLRNIIQYNIFLRVYNMKRFNLKEFYKA